MREHTSTGGGGAMKLEPLTPAEQAVAAENHYIVERFLASKKLPPDEWYDVVVFRYLRAIELWFRRPDLYKYQFTTIAWRNMTSAVSNERVKQSRRIRAISLDTVIPGTDGMTFGDTITADNLDFIPYTEVSEYENYIRC